MKHRCFRHKDRRTSAFTLIELLVVIAIVGILAAILIPVFTRNRDKSRQAVCQSNMKQLGIAILLYQGDYDGIMPPIAAGVRANGTWRELIQPYLKNVQVTACPSNPMGEYWEIQDLGKGNQLVTNHVSYTAVTCGAGLGRCGFSGASYNPLKATMITNPAQLIQVIESTNSGTRVSIDSISDVTVDGVAGTNNQTWPPRQSKSCAGPSSTPISPNPNSSACVSSGSIFAHHGASNFLFADGHIKGIKPLETMNNDDGSGTNLWDREGKPFTDISVGYTAETQAKVKANLAFAQTTFP